MSPPIQMLFLLLPLAACEAAYDPPSVPAHDDIQGAGAHANGKEKPFLCHDPVSGRANSCSIGRPEPAALSCDASGCHGDYDYDVGPTEAERHLRGSDGPSCYTCHDQEWNNARVIGAQ